MAGVVIVGETGVMFGLSWSEDWIVYSHPDQGLMRVSQRGGNPELLVPIRRGEVNQGPSMLPGDGVVLFTVAEGRGPGFAPTTEMWETAKISVQLLPSGERKTLINGGSDARYLPTGHLAYARRGTVFVAPFDLQGLQVGEPVPMLEGVARIVAGRASNGYAQFDVSRTGTVVYESGPLLPDAQQPRLVLVDRSGKQDPLKVPTGYYERPRASPDGRRVAFGTDDGNGAAVWVYDLSGSSSMRQLTFEGRNRFPVWFEEIATRAGR